MGGPRIPASRRSPGDGAAGKYAESPAGPIRVVSVILSLRERLRLEGKQTPLHRNPRGTREKTLAGQGIDGGITFVRGSGGLSPGIKGKTRAEFVTLGGRGVIYRSATTHAHGSRCPCYISESANCTGPDRSEAVILTRGGEESGEEFSS